MDCVFTGSLCPGAIFLWTSETGSPKQEVTEVAFYGIQALSLHGCIMLECSPYLNKFSNEHVIVVLSSDNHRSALIDSLFYSVHRSPE